MEMANISLLDEECIMALIVGAVRAERFCEGVLLSFFDRGSMYKWFCRLKELDDLR